MKVSVFDLKHAANIFCPKFTKKNNKICEKPLIPTKRCVKVITSNPRRESTVMRSLLFAAEYYFYYFFFSAREKSVLLQKKVLSNCYN